MQPLGFTAAQTNAYLARLFGSHDYRVSVEVLTLDEVPTGTVRFLDGQVNIQDASSTVRRTATLSVSDPAGALDFAGASAWSGSTVWVSRLIRVRHTITVPGLGDVTVTPFIGPPSAMNRQGAEVSIECQDKTALAVRGCSPLTVPKGMTAVAAIRKLLAERTGEFRFRLGTSSRRLSKAYSVGWSDEASPWLVAATIARRELGMQLIMSCDGYATLRRTPSAIGLVVPHVTAEPSSGVDFTTLSNWVRVAGKKTSKTRGSVTTTAQPVATAIATGGGVSPSQIARKGVKRYMPLVLSSDSYTTQAQVKSRADAELDRATRLQSSPSFTCVPFFHADADDLIKFKVPGDDVTVRLSTGSIPLGPSEMTVGAVRWVSRSAPSRVTATTVRTRTVKKKSPKKKRK